MTATTQPPRTTTLRETMADGTTVELTVALDACGVPVDDLALPEAMYDELNRGWSAFMQTHLEREVARVLRKPTPPKTQARVQGQSYTSQIFDPEEGWGQGWGLGRLLFAGWALVSTTVASILAILYSLLVLFPAGGEVTGEVTEDSLFGFLAALLLLFFNPLWWTSTFDAMTGAIDKRRYMAGLIAILLATTFGFAGAYAIQAWRENWQVSWEGVLVTGVLATFFSAMTPMPWEFIRAIKARLPGGKRAQRRYEQALKEYELRRDAILADTSFPKLMCAFIDSDDGANRVFEAANVQWTKLLGEIREAVGTARALKMREEAAGAPPEVIAQLERAIERRERQAQAIRDDENRAALARASFRVFSKELAGRTVRLTQQKETLAWLQREGVAYDAAEVALSRTRAEIDAALRWFYRQFRLQMAQLDAGEEVAALPAPRETVDDLLEQRRADLEVAAALTKA